MSYHRNESGQVYAEDILLVMMIVFVVSMVVFGLASLFTSMDTSYSAITVNTENHTVYVTHITDKKGWMARPNHLHLNGQQKEHYTDNKIPSGVFTDKDAKKAQQLLTAVKNAPAGSYSINSSSTN